MFSTNDKRRGFVSKLLATAAIVTAAIGAAAAQAHAGSRLIASVTPPTGSSTSGFAFDDLEPSRPLITDNFGGAFRIDIDTGAVGTPYTLPTGSTVRGLAYNGGGNYYQTRGQPGYLWTLNLPSATPAPVSGPGFGKTYNFLDLALDRNSGQLWAVTDEITDGFAGGGSLYKIDRDTGAISLLSRLPGIGQLTSIAVGPAGEVLVSSGTTDSLYRVDPVTYQTSLATTLFSGNSTGYMVDFAYSPERSQWFGIFRDGVASSNRLYEITNVPEPTLLSVAIAAAYVVRRKRRWCDHFHVMAGRPSSRNRRRL